MQRPRHDIRPNTTPNRNNSGGRIRCHDAQLFLNEVVNAMEPEVSNFPLNWSKEEPSSNDVSFANEYSMEMEEERSFSLPPLRTSRSLQNDRRRSIEDMTRPATQNKRGSKAHRHMIETKRRLRQKQHEIEMEKERRKVQRLRQQREKEREMRFVNKYNDLIREKEDFVDKHISRVIAVKRMTDERRRMKLHNEWTENVYEPLQTEISQKIENIDLEELSRRRRDIFEKYLQEGNRKSAGIFRDIIIETEYDPFEYSGPQYRIKYGGTLLDPVKKSIIRRKQEEDVQKSMSLFLSRQNNRMANLGNVGLVTETMIDNREDDIGYRRDALDVTLWGVVQDTNYGYFERMFNKADPTAPVKSRFMASSVKLDHFNYPRDNAASRAEENPGKRVDYPRMTKRTVDMLTGYEAQTRNRKSAEKTRPNRPSINLFEEYKEEPRVPRANRPAASLTTLHGGILLNEPQE